MHKRLERLTLVPILHSIFDDEVTFDPNSESGILTRTLQAPIAGSPKGFRKRQRDINCTCNAALGNYFYALHVKTSVTLHQKMHLSDIEQFGLQLT